MFVAIRFLIPLLVVLTVIYIALSIYSRLMRRRKLIAHWEKKGLNGDRNAFLKRGMQQYDKSFRKKLLLGVYVIPLGAISLLIYITNFK